MERARETVIETRDITKRYGDFVAVDHLSLEIYRGEIFGLLGPNGAGKTTTILMLLGLTEPSEGMALVEGHDPTREPLAVKRVVGYLPDNVGFYPDMTARENLLYTAALNRLPQEEAEGRASRLLEEVGLGEVSDRQVKEFSRGMRQRLGIADLLIKSPRIIILDEPTLGIDPEGVAELLDLIVRLAREQEMTVLISSHLLHQVQQICDRVGIFVRGRLVAAGPVAHLARQLAAGQSLTVELQVEAADEALLASLRGLPGVARVERAGDMVVVEGEGQVDPRPQVVQHLVGRGISLLSLRLQGYDLDDIYRRYFQGGEDS